MSRMHDLLDASLRLPNEYRTGLTSHMPMALQALATLGAGDARLAAFFDAYARRFAGAPETIEGFDAARDGYAARIESHGSEAALRDALPALWPGFAAAAFHGPICVAHAVESGHAGELAAALGYWAVRAQRLPEPRDGALAPLGFDAWFDALEASALGFHSAQPLISGRLQQAAETEPYHTLAGTLVVAADALTRLARRAAALYAQTGNFTVLHLVTGARAARVLSRHAAAPVPVTIWPALAAGVIASGIRARSAAPAGTAGWPQVVAAAIASDDDHVIKLVHACADHDAFDPGRPEYLQAARRALG